MTWTSTSATPGRDEIGDVAAAFRDLRVTAGRLAAEIRATTTAIGENRLEHRADVAAFEGTWAQLLAGLNETTAAFARLHSRRQRAERELAGLFNLSMDLLCIAGTDGYLKRVNPAFEQTLGYTSDELLAKPYATFVHPNDRAVTLAAHEVLSSGRDLVRFENRYLRKDGAECWLQWNARSVPEEGLIYAAGRDVTASRRAREEQAALRRVATLVAQGVAPAAVFDAVVAEMRMILGAENTRLMRYEQGRTAVVLATSHEPGLELPVGEQVSLEDENVATRVWRSGRPERMERFSEQTGADAGHVQPAGCPAGRRGTDHRRGPALGRHPGRLAADPSRAPAPRNASPSSPRWSPPRYPTPRPARTWPLPGPGSWPPATRPGGGSSVTCMTAPSSGWSRSGSSCAPPRTRCHPAIPGSALSWPGWPAGWARCRPSCASCPAASTRRS